jgi:tetratricopeptide (TPR) repeat protein
MDITDHTKDIDELLSSAHWSDALLVMELKKKDHELSKSDFFKLGLIYFNLNQYDEGFAVFELLAWDNYSDCAWLRRMIIAPLINSKNFIWSEKLLQLIIKKHPDSTLDLRTLSSVLIRQSKRSEGCIYLEQILAIEKENYRVAAQLIQIKLQDNQLEDAVKLAKRYAHAYALDERLLKIAFQTLAKAREFQFCINKMLDMDFSKQSLDIGMLSAQIAYDGKNYRLVEQIIFQLQTLGYNDARIGLILAKIQLASGAANADDVIDILIKANKLDPENIQINNLLGDLLLKAGNFKKALKYLEILKTSLPKNPHTRLMHAKALKFIGDYEQAANEMLEVVKLLPHSPKLKRYAASALAQANRHEEAKIIFNEGLILRNKELPHTFAYGLSQLGHKLETINFPPARFEWLWNIVKNNNPLEEIKRPTYEKLAKWVYLLDLFLVDWLECRPDQADEAMVFFEDLSDIHAVLSDKLSLGNGLILAGAHVGPLFSIPLALELLGLPHKWLASTPSISSMSYKNTLISTSENTETEVVRQIIKTLKKGSIAALAVDGAINPAAPKIDFENQRITYSDFAAKMSYRTKAPSFFIVSFWENNRFCLKLEQLPTPCSDEKLEDFCSRWTKDFLSALKCFLVLNPGNARLSGGIWREI